MLESSFPKEIRALHFEKMEKGIKVVDVMLEEAGKTGAIATIRGKRAAHKILRSLGYTPTGKNYWWIRP